MVRRVQLHQGLRHRTRGEIEETRDQHQHHRQRVAGGHRESGDRDTPEKGKRDRDARAGLEQAAALQNHAARERTGGVGREQHAVGPVGALRAEVVREFGHLRHVGTAHQQGRSPAEHDHRDHGAVARGLAHRRAQFGETDAVRDTRRLRPGKAVGCAPQPDDQRQIEDHVGEQPVGRPEREQQHAAHARPHQHAEKARGRIQPHRALQRLLGHHVVDDDLAGRRPDDARETMNGEQHHRMPGFELVGEEKQPPAQ